MFTAQPMYFQNYFQANSTTQKRKIIQDSKADVLVSNEIDMNSMLPGDTYDTSIFVQPNIC